jgi:hypothetical protein
MKGLFITLIFAIPPNLSAARFGRRVPVQTKKGKKKAVFSDSLLLNAVILISK